ncbi:MAG: zeta toxin family protein [Bacteroidetes bacterium]|nr:zeta toxin family protein [Bacteroidota bacterium]
MPILYIIAGPNGAGKTTSAESMLPGVLNCIEFVNADLIARGISPYNPESVAIKAGRIMLNRINELMNSGVDFVIETTLSTLSYAQFIKECKHKGYEIALIFVWLNHPDIAKIRVKQRVERGGHNIPEDVIERRYYKGIKNLNKIFLPLCNGWMICDNSDDLITLVARKENSDIVVFDKVKYNLICHD